MGVHMDMSAASVLLQAADKLSRGAALESAIGSVEQGASSSASVASQVRSPFHAESRQGCIGVSAAHNAAVMIEVLCETDLTRHRRGFTELVRETAAIAQLDDVRDRSVLLHTRLCSGNSVEDQTAALSEEYGERITIGRLCRLQALHRKSVVCAHRHAGRVAAAVELAGATPWPKDSQSAGAVRELGRQLAMHIAASQPNFVDRESVPSQVQQQAETFITGKLKSDSAEMHATVQDQKLQEGLDSFFSSVALLDQPYVNDPSKTIRDVLKAFNDAYACNVSIVQFVRMEVGEEDDES